MLNVFDFFNNAYMLPEEDKIFGLGFSLVILFWLSYEAW